LNGGHTLACGLAYLGNLDTVAEGMNHHLFAPFIQSMLLDEIAPTIPQPLTLAEAQTFALRVLDRFRNPFIEHKWLSITMQYTSKMQMRNVLTIQRYYQTFEMVPERMAMGFAAYLLFMRAQKTEEGQFFGQRNGVDYLIQDDQAAYFYTIWQNSTPQALVATVLKNEDLWGIDLSQFKGFEEKVALYLTSMLAHGVFHTLESLNASDDPSLLQTLKPSNV
jgi:tagaturonate reductase